MVSAWGGRTPNIGEAFIQGTLFAQRTRPPFHVSGQSFPRAIAPTPAVCELRLQPELSCPVWSISAP